MIQAATNTNGLFEAATKVTNQYALSAFGIAAVVTLVWIVNRSRRQTPPVRVPILAWFIVFASVAIPTAGGLGRLLVGHLEALDELSGHVTDSSGEPARDVMVSIDENQFTSDRNGYYHVAIPRKYLTGKSPYFTVVATSSEAFHSFSKVVNAETRTQDIQLERLVSKVSLVQPAIIEHNNPPSDNVTATVERGGVAETEGEHYWMGVGVPLDYSKAMEQFQLAVRQGNAKANAQIGWMYENGLGVSVDCLQAKSWYDKAYRAGYTRVSWNIGRLYDIGCGVSQDPLTAIIWYQKAAQIGVPEAVRDLKKLGVNQVSE